MFLKMLLLSNGSMTDGFSTARPRAKPNEPHRPHANSGAFSSPFLALVPLKRGSGDGGCLAPQQSGASQANPVDFYLVDGRGNWRIRGDKTLLLEHKHQLEEASM